MSKGMPWFPFWPADWTIGTMAMSQQQKGDYIDLIAADILYDGISEDLLPRLAKPDSSASNLRALLDQKFVRRRGVWTHPKQDEPRRKYAQKVDAGRKGGKAKRKAKREAESVATDQAAAAIFPDSQTSEPESGIQNPESKTENAQGRNPESGSPTGCRSWPDPGLVPMPPPRRVGPAADPGQPDDGLAAAVQLAAQVCRRLQPQTLQDRQLIARAAIIADQHLSENWLQLAVGGVTETQPARRPFAKLLTCLRDQAQQLHRTSYDGLADQLTVPRRFYDQLDQLLL